MLWVLTDPHRGHEFAYNRWYERDHYFAGCMIGADTLAGSRFVATARHKVARFPDPSGLSFDRLDGSYACFYFILDGAHEDWLDWATPQVHRLYEADRGFASRNHYNTGVYRHRWRAHRDPDPVPLELALDHRYPGMVAMFVEADGADEWLAATLPGWLEGSTVETVAAWTPEPLLDTKPDFVPVDPKGLERLLVALFDAADPLTHWDDYRALAAGRPDAVAWAAPFVQTSMGTDRYVDDLWPT